MVLFLWLLGLTVFFVTMMLMTGCWSPKAPPGYEDDWTPGTNIEWNAVIEWRQLER
jgi:hypothetical protein